MKTPNGNFDIIVISGNFDIIVICNYSRTIIDTGVIVVLGHSHPKKLILQAQCLETQARREEFLLKMEKLRQQLICHSCGNTRNR